MGLPRYFYGVAEYQTHSPEAADALTARLTSKGCDDLGGPGCMVQVSCGPFLCTGPTLADVAANARFFLGGLVNVRQFGVAKVLNASPADNCEVVFDLTPYGNPVGGGAL